MSEGTGAGIYVFSDDHCPAHVHARHRGDGWIARVRFSYLADTVELMSIIPVKNVPLKRVVNRLLREIQERLSDCRRSWWLTRRTTCLANQWAVLREPGKIELLARPMPGARRIAEAEYDPENDRVDVVFLDSATEQVKS
jgi:predicted lipid carrier protein YhbT